MIKKDVLIDFSIYLLLLGDEFHNNELHFFDTSKKNNASYDNYVKAINNLIIVDDFLWDTDTSEIITDINSLTELISKKEISFLQEYINLEFIFGYPNDVNEDGFPWGATYNLNLSVIEIEDHFKDYAKFKKLIPNKYITYYQQYLNYLLNHSSRATKITKLEVDNFFKNKDSVPSSIYSKLKDRLESNLIDNLSKNTQNTTFQIQGGFDNYGFIFNYNETLTAILKSHSPKYSNLDLNIDPKQYYSLIEYEYFLFKIEGKRNTSENEDQKKLRDEFENLKLKNQEQISFLKNKGFNNEEIDRIFNCFTLNKFCLSNIRYIKNLSQVDFFGLFYFFYRFDFLKENQKLSFEEQKDFIQIPLIGEINKNDYRKYYKHSNDLIIHNQKPHQRYPFKKVDNLLKKIESELRIDLKNINLPPNLKTSI